jgi:hypothetical protein
MAQILDVNVSQKPQLLNALQDALSRVHQIRAQRDEVKRRAEAFELQKAEAALAAERERRVAGQADFQNQLAAREAALADAARVRPDAPGIPAAAGDPSTGMVPVEAVEAPPAPMVNIPGLSMGDRDILPPQQIRQRLESELINAARQKAAVEKEAAGFVAVTPEVQASLPPELRGLFGPGSHLPPTLVTKLAENKPPSRDTYQIDLGDRVEEFDKASNSRIATHRKGAAPRSGVDASDEVASAVELLAGGTPASDLPKYVKNPKARAQAIQDARGRGDVFNTPKEKDKVEKLRDIQRDAEELQTLIAKPEVQAAVGLMAGNWTALKGKVVDLPPDVQRAHQLMASLSDTELRRRSGAQINEDEFQRMLRFTTDPTKTVGHNMTAINGLLKASKAGVDAVLRPGGTKAEPKADTPRKATKRFNPATGQLEDVK